MKKQTMGDRISELRDKYGLSQSQFANYVGVDRLTISNIERGVTKKIQLDAINKVASVYGTTKEWIESGEGDMLPNGKIELKPFNEPEVDNPWKNEAWSLAKDQLSKKDDMLDKLAVSFDRLTEILSRSNVNFLEPVKETA